MIMSETYGKDKMFSLPSNKLFNNASSKKSHESGSSSGGEFGLHLQIRESKGSKVWKGNTNSLDHSEQLLGKLG